MTMLAGVLIWQIQHLFSTFRAVAETDRVIAAANATYRLLVDQETGLRGYLLVGSRDFLEPYNSAQSSLNASLDDLARRVATHPAQARRVDEIRTRRISWGRFARQAISYREGGDDYQGLVRTRLGKNEMDALRRVLGLFIDSEEAQREHRVQTTRQTMLVVFLTGGGLTLLLGGLIAFSGSRQFGEVVRTYERSLQERKQSEARLGGILNTAMDAVVTVDPDQRVVVFNAAAERMFCCSAADVIGQPLDPFIPERHREAHRHYIQEFGESGVTNHARRTSGELTALRTDGEEFPIEAAISQVEVDGQKLYTAIVRDITERRRTAAALRRSEERFRALIENTSDIITILDEEGRIRYHSPAIQRVLGYHPEELLGTPVFDLVHPEDREKVNQRFQRELAQPGQVTTMQCRAQHRDGSWRYLDSIEENLLHNPEIAGVVVSSRDVTEQRQLEAQFFQSQKMETAGRLAGGIAHDFNNMLAVINGYSDLLLSRLSSDDPDYEPLSEVKAAGERAAELTRQLLAFSRKQLIVPKVLDLNEVVAGVGRMLQRLIGEDIDLVSLPAAQPAVVLADPAQLEQVIINLAVNARDAMPQGGKLTVAVDHVELDDTYVREHLDVQPGSYVMLTVSDTGFGMNEATKAQVFEPFFTTKAPGEGTGLGLATVYGIVKQSGGAVWVYSEPGRGSTFKIYLPVPTSEGRREEAPGATDARTGSETILLVEDEARVRKLVRRTLEEAGYAVLEAESSEEATRLCQEYEGPIHLLMSDVVMPGRSGRETAEEIQTLRPEVKVLFMSGYTDDAVVRHGVLHAETAFLQKPFNRADLHRKLRELLGP